MTPRTPDGAPLVGRAAVLDRLEHALGEACGGRGALCFVRGETGVGKTALAHALSERATARGIPCVPARCYDEPSPPLAVWHALLDRAANSVGLDRASLPDPLGTGPPAHTAWQLMQAAARFLEEAAKQPLLLVLDDLQWADRDSLDLPEFTTRRIDQLPVLLVLTYRPEGLARTTPLFHSLPRLMRDRRWDEIRLGRWLSKTPRS